MSSRIDRILELLDNPTQRTTEFAPGDHDYLIGLLARTAGEAVEAMQPFLEALRGAGVSLTDLLARLDRSDRVSGPWKRNKHFGYGR